MPHPATDAALPGDRRHALTPCPRCRVWAIYVVEALAASAYQVHCPICGPVLYRAEVTDAPLECPRLSAADRHRRRSARPAH